MELSVEGRPTFSTTVVRGLIRDLYGIDGTLEPLPAEWDQNFRLDCGDAEAFVVKIANQGRRTEVLEFQNAAMNRLSEIWVSGKSPRVLSSLAGEKIAIVSGRNGALFRMRVLTYLPGKPLATVRPLCERSLDRLGYALGDLDRCLADFRHEAMDRELPWDLRRAEWIIAYTRRMPNLQKRGIVEGVLLQYRGRITPVLANLPTSVIHNDANDENILLAPDAEGGWRVAGLLDFGDMLRSHTVNELAIACAYAVLGSADPLKVMEGITAGYHRARPLTGDELFVLFPLTCMRLCVSVTMSAIAAEEDPDNEYRQISDRPAWDMLEQLERIDWRDAENRLRIACGLEKRPSTHFGKRRWKHGELLEERRMRIGPSLSLSYETPLEIVRGRGQFLFEPGGKAYLDCVNNVCHVGHCHAKVLAALSEQAAILNTNTRYLHPYLVEYAERLTATMPDPLKVCYFVNSGSEANELAVRLARTHTDRHDAIVLEDGYHGSTSMLVDLSPYKCEGPGGRGLPDWAHEVVKPDPYRGPYRGTGEGVGRAYAEHVRKVCERLDAEGHPPAFFICEPILGCGGQIVLPEGYLRRAFAHVRSVGGLCVVDEVQVGMGRVGSHWWAFETQGVVPDIVTIGKPIGNGHPLGAVVTTTEIARSFDNGMEFFSTFGGNPVSIAVGLAVLDVIEEERLRDRAARVGSYLTEGFLALSAQHPEIGDVRGLGMFMGVELVLDRDKRAPATKLTSLLIERLKTWGILLSAEGPHHNVLKIKPPLQFLETDADLLLNAVDRALSEIREDRRSGEAG
ncbi:MAG: aminotransferase class III-fold pyridoxal phosphate-dependent enzyme [Candidatus Latescibacteria bacterium]|nr:aminotransferase class III-fold pyridoxal phosphate-dependent enzyme [Candidatus Latescibacterota bacterium]NIO27121.1 aminotransferase class III-fold pyridoxal phosphate-dependent enzyme [Candidatus Latescibacterota bacterium]NIO54645.1 aminotransferase class III-fold pyridoxal phosphate-dependent enzyme [Candidatus Latescibacterota bacterium]NIT00728.1 aminotransferase class III-fold pyridoxal phosphate-dependent enzyme [Candidatus Latescibacterota bacterium]NIT37651.1 aminotransferase cla